jgi:hypothetical protein
MTTATTQVYRTSNVFLAPAVIIIFSVMIVVLSATLIWQHAIGAISRSEWGFALFVFIFVAVMLGAATISHHRIEIYNQTAKLVWFPAYRKTILASDIISVTTKRVTPWRNGLGIRLIGNATLALMNRGGDGVLITTTDNRCYLIVISNPQELAETLRRVDGMIDRPEPN